MKRSCLVVAAIFLIPFFAFAATDASPTSVNVSTERILDFHSDIVINEDSSMLVTETISVVALGQQIRHGIYRDFPTKYKDSLGNSHNVGYQIVSVMRDGHVEDYHTEDKSNGVRVYFGNANALVNQGTHVYAFTYKTDRQIGYFDTYDELYWNVTGNGWVFPIDNASAAITLPGTIEASALQASGYTGAQGSKATDLSSEVAISSAKYQTIRPLSPYEGLTVVLAFPKGIVREPTAWENAKYFFRDNMDAWIYIIMLMIVFLYYFVSWKKVGVDPKAHSIVAQYDSPRGLSPGEIRYLDRMGFDNKALVAMIISMGVKGYVKVEELKVNYKVTRVSKDGAKLSGEEKKLADKMFEDGEVFEIKRANYTDVITSEVAAREFLERKFKNDYFVRNWKHVGYGILISLVALLVGTGMQPGENIPSIMFLMIWLSFWALFVYVFAKQGVEFWSRKKSKAIGSFFTASGLICIELLVIFLVLESFSVSLMLFVIVIVFLNIFFGDILKRRTLLGRQVQDEIEGFKMFLSVTEKDRMNFHNPPERTPELFEKFLPYALALGVENKWAEQFEEVFQKEFGPDGYHPSWYSGRHLTSGSLAGIASGMSKGMSSAISSSSVAPGSSSGSGGGGSSGGGGGGGGGGGW